MSGFSDVLPSDAKSKTMYFVDDDGNFVPVSPTKPLPVSVPADLSGITVADDPYDATAWDGSTEIPTKNAVRDKVEALSDTFVTLAAHDADLAAEAADRAAFDDVLRDRDVLHAISAPYNVVPGAADNTDAVLAFVAAMKAQNKPGILPPGLINVASTITPTDHRGFALEGSGYGAYATGEGTTLRWTGAANGVVLKLYGCPQYSLKRIEIDGNAKAAGAGLELRRGPTLVTQMGFMEQVRCANCKKGLKIGNAGSNEAQNDQSLVLKSWFRENDIGVSFEGDQSILWSFFTCQWYLNATSGIQTGSAVGDGGAFNIDGAYFGGNGTDILINRLNAAMTLANMHSEGSARFIDANVNNSTPSRLVTVRNSKQNSRTGTASSIRWTNSSSLMLEGVNVVGDIEIGNLGNASPAHRWLRGCSYASLVKNAGVSGGTYETTVDGAGAKPVYGAPTGTATRTTFDTTSVTLPQLAERVKALIDDFRNNGPLA